MMYYANWVLTCAQLDLIAADVSVVDYNYGRKKNKRGKKGEFNNAKANQSDVKKARDAWMKKYGDKVQGETAGGIAMSDVFGSFKVKEDEPR